MEANLAVLGCVSFFIFIPPPDLFQGVFSRAKRERAGFGLAHNFLAILISSTCLLLLLPV